MSARWTRTEHNLNVIANHPEVRPWLGGKGEVVLDGLLADPANFAVEADGGGWLFVGLMSGIYEVHSFFLPGARGAAMIRASHQALRMMFTETDCVEIVSKAPHSNRAARGYQQIMGFREVFTRRAAFVCAAAPEPSDVSYVSLRLSDWMMRDTETLRVGRQFHDWLEKEKLRAGSPLPVHPEDPAHERAVGAAFLMFRATNPRKAIRTYNEWALFAGYAPIFLLSDKPLRVDVRDAIVSLHGDDLEMIECRLEQSSEPLELVLPDQP